MRASSTDLRSGSLSGGGAGSAAVDTRQAFLTPGAGGTPGSGGGKDGGGGGPPFFNGSRSSSDSVWVTFAFLPSRLEIGGVTRCGPPSRPGWNGAGVGERGNVPSGGVTGGVIGGGGTLAG